MAPEVSIRLVPIAAGLVFAGCGWLVGVDFEAGHVRAGDDAGDGSLANPDGEAVHDADCIDCADAAIFDSDPIVAMVAAGFHTLVLTRAGKVKWWGSYVVPGGDTLVDSVVPLRVDGVSDAKSVAAGAGNGCVVTATGTVKCWGHGEVGQLGADAGSTMTPVEIAGLGAGVSSVTVGGAHACAILASRSVKCWGLNADGELGDSTTKSSVLPVDVRGLSDVVALSAGRYHTCALTSGGTVRCWGYNKRGQLGVSPKTFSPVPVDIVGIPEPVASLAAGETYVCILSTLGNVFCWGGIGFDPTGDSLAPVKVERVGAAAAASLDVFQHRCLVTTGGGAQCWGTNYQGEVGHASAPAFVATPVDVDGLTSGVALVAGGYLHSCALMVGGAVKCWGSATNGALGRDAQGSYLPPVDVNGL